MQRTLLALLATGAGAASLRAREAPKPKLKLEFKPVKTPAVALPGDHGRHCFALNAGEQAEVRSVSLRYRNASYLVETNGPAPEAPPRTALYATIEALLGECDRVTTTGRDWVIDAGAGTGEVAALAASVGCAVAAFDPQEKHVQSLRTTGCLNDFGHPFVAFPGAATGQTGRVPGLLASTSKGVAGEAQGIALDSVFIEGQANALAAGGAATTVGSDWGAAVALLKVTQRECCQMSSNLWALQGAAKLFKSGRVRCLMVEVDFDRGTMKDLLATFSQLELQGYTLAHTGPLDSPHSEITKEGTYPLFEMDAKQLGEINGELDRIRRFDERSGIRAYSNGLSLDREGKYFDYTDHVFACRGRFPDRLQVQGKARIRYSEGMWWPEKANITGR